MDTLELIATFQNQCKKLLQLNIIKITNTINSKKLNLILWNILLSS